MNEEQHALLETLFRTYLNELEVHAYSLLGNWDDAHLAAQEAFHIACEKIDVLADHPNQIGWLKTTVKNVCRNMLRTRERQIFLFTSLDELSDTSKDAPSTTDEPEEDISGLFSSFLSKDEIDLLKSIVLDEVPYTDTAETLHITMWACRKRIQRIIKKIQEKHEEAYGENFPL